MKRYIFLFLVAVFVGYRFVDDFNPDDLRGKNVVVTGASSGIGKQMAYHYAKMGANVLITARSEDRLKKVIKQCELMGYNTSRYHYFVADMSNMAHAAALIKYAEKSLGGIDYLVLNHIASTNLGFWVGDQQNLTALQHTLTVNVLSYVHLASYAMPLLERSNGSIIVVSSVAGRITQPYVVPYSSSKFALNGFFSGLRQELNLRGIDVSITLCIIGLVDTSNAMTNIRNFGLTNIMKWATLSKSQDVALAIIRSGATRTWELQYPYLEVKLSSIVTNLSPWLMDKFFELVLDVNS